MVEDINSNIDIKTPPGPPSSPTMANRTFTTDSECVSEQVSGMSAVSSVASELHELGLDEQGPTLLGPGPNLSRRGSDGVLVRGILPPIVRSCSPVNPKGVYHKTLSASPIITVAVVPDGGDDHVFQRIASPILQRRSQSLLSSRSNTPSPSLLAAQAPSSNLRSLAPSPPPYAMQNGAQNRMRILRRGSLPTSSLQPAPSPSPGDPRSRLDIRRNSYHNCNVPPERERPISHQSNGRSLSPYPHNLGVFDTDHTALLRRGSEGTLNIPARFHHQNQNQNQHQRNKSASISVDFKLNSSFPPSRLGTNNNNNSVANNRRVNDKAVTNRKNKRPGPDQRKKTEKVTKRAPVKQETKEEEESEFDTDSTASFEESEDEETRKWIFDWLKDVEESTTPSPAVALDDYYQYSTSKETAINVVYSES